ncbi:hypothetical protein [Simkania sp.]|uniref:hypothetical protein n=1 Tax=Simkania sp. TaxID=34094 RepID=UPI003B52980E
MKKLVLLFPIFATSAFAQPYQIVIFRHAEKVPAVGFVRNMDALLNAQGQQRAAYLVNFLLQNQIIDQKAHPIGGIYVPRSYVKDPRGTYNYVRCTQTIIPLFHEASACLKETQHKNVAIHNQFSYAEANQVIPHLMKQPFNGQTVVICWEHTEMPKLLVEQFENLKNSFPDIGEDEYDKVWVIRFDGNEPTALTFTQVKSDGFNNP